MSFFLYWGKNERERERKTEKAREEEKKKRKRDSDTKKKNKESNESKETKILLFFFSIPPPNSHLIQVYDTYVLSDPVGWAKGWGSLAADVAADPVMRNRVMFDLMNEPDGRGIGWATGPGKGNYGATALFLMAMDEIYKVNPTGLFLIEGSGQPGVQMSWGDGFASDPWVVGSGQSAAPFFEAIMSKPYAANVVLSPHVYPASVFDNHNPAVTTGAPVRDFFF